MREPRRDAWRLPSEGTGWLAAPQFRAACTVDDISVSGARVHISTLRRAGHGPLPEQLTLTTTLGGEQVTVAGAVTRAEQREGSLSLAIRFFDGDGAGLGWLINQAQRAEINGGAPEED